jgi:hypothetical protein
MGQSSIDLGSDDHGARFTWTPISPHVEASGKLELDVWDVDGEPSHVELGSDAALELAQWINEQLGRD